MQDGSKTYVLGTGNAAARRLDIQNEMLAIKSYDHLKKAGLSKGQTVFDIGCGSGAVTIYLAKAVGKEGRVYAVDVSQKQIEYAKEKVKKEGLDNVTFINDDIAFASKLPQNIADIVYIRLVLMHMSNPVKAIEQMKLILKSGGVVVSQEFYGREALNTSSYNAINTYINTLFQLREYYGLDYNIGEKLELLFKNAGYNKVHANHVRDILTSKESKEIFLLSFAEWRNKAIEAKILSLAETELLEKMLKEIPETDEEAISSMACFLVAQK